MLCLWTVPWGSICLNILHIMVRKGVSNVGNISGDVPTYVISDDLRAKF